MRKLLVGMTWFCLLTAPSLAAAGTLTLEYRLTSGSFSGNWPAEPAISGKATLRLPVSGPLTVITAGDGGGRGTLLSLSIVGALNSVRLSRPSTRAWISGPSGEIRFPKFCCTWYGVLYGPPYVNFVTASFGWYRSAGTPGEYSRARGSFAEVSRTYVPTTEPPTAALTGAAAIAATALLVGRRRARRRLG